jgi:ABC-type transport system substrate-binding protein
MPVLPLARNRTSAPCGATANFLNNPERFRSKNTKFEFNIEKANQILEVAGWKKGGDGIRAKDGKPLKFACQTSINAPGQKTQAIVFPSEKCRGPLCRHDVVSL